MRILIDFDGVLNDLTKVWVAELNRQFHTNVLLDDITEMDMSKFFPDLNYRQIYWPYMNGTLYFDISPPKWSQEVISELATKHDVYIVTNNAPGVGVKMFKEFIEDGYNPRAFEYMYRYFWEFFPNIDTSHVIITTCKDLVQGDVIIDDNPDNLVNHTGRLKLLFDAPYNQDNDDFKVDDYGITRVKSWKQIGKIIEAEDVS